MEIRLKKDSDISRYGIVDYGIEFVCFDYRDLQELLQFGYKLRQQIESCKLEPRVTEPIIIGFTLRATK